jgi:hypothetical protein
MSVLPVRRVRSNVFGIEAALLRGAVDALSDNGQRCCHCHRTPLTGETIFFYRGARRTEAVCELCRPLRAAEPDGRELVRSPEQAQTVTMMESRAH